MNSIQLLCFSIAEAFEEQRIEDGYTGIIAFTDQINATASMMSEPLQKIIQQKLIILQHHLALHDDVQVAHLFREDLFMLVRHISQLSN